MTYDEALKVWGKQRLLADKPELIAKSDLVVVFEVNVRVVESMGYCETCWSPGYVEIDIIYAVVGDDNDVRHYELNANDNSDEYETLTSVIRQLEAIAEESESDS